MDPIVYNIIVEGIRTLFLVVVPILVAVGVVGALTAAFQSATLVSDPSLGYVFRLLACIGVFYFFLNSFLSSLHSLAQLALR